MSPKIPTMFENHEPYIFRKSATYLRYEDEAHKQKIKMIQRKIEKTTGIRPQFNIGLGASIEDPDNQNIEIIFDPTSPHTTELTLVKFRLEPVEEPDHELFARIQKEISILIMVGSLPPKPKDQTFPFG